MSKKKEQEKKTRKASRRQIEQLAAQIADEMAVGLFGRTEEYAANVGRYYSIAVDELLKLSARVELDPESEVFSFSDNKRMSEKSNAILRGLYSAVYQEIRSGVIREWENANAARDRLVELVMGKGARDDKRFASLFARNREAMEAFFRRKNEYGGLNLSQKVWKYTSQFKDEMELALSVSLGRGDSAATVSRHVRQYLQEPDRLFRRVRDEDGNLKLSKRAAAYHPGQGQYRSSYKNAMRLARTETNIAYRSADYERRQRHPWIVGVEVKRVHDKTECKLCDALAGKYPKDFKFVGWHPQCRCYTIDVLAPVEEVNAYHRAMLDGEDVNGWQFSGQITEPHDGFKKWIGENQERIDKAAEKGTLPYWIKDNPKYVKVEKASPAAAAPSEAIIDEHRKEYERLKADPNYRDVMFDERNGGLMATHVGHNNKDDGKRFFGDMSKIDLERECQETVYKMGGTFILRDESRLRPNGDVATALDANINGVLSDIRSVTSVGKDYAAQLNSKNRQLGKWNHENPHEQSSTVTLYFHDPAMFDEKKMRDSIERLKGFHKIEKGTQKVLDELIEIHFNKVFVILKGADRILAFYV